MAAQTIDPYALANYQAQMQAYQARQGQRALGQQQRYSTQANNQNLQQLMQFLNLQNQGYDEARQANESRYLDILSGRVANRDTILGDVNAYGESGRADINRAYKDRLYDSGVNYKNNMTDLANRGLNGTTERMKFGGQYDKSKTDALDSQQRSLLALNDSLLSQRIGANERLSGGVFDFMERRTDDYPDQSAQQGLWNLLGQGGGLGGGFGGGVGNNIGLSGGLGGGFGGKVSALSSFGGGYGGGGGGQQGHIPQLRPPTPGPAPYVAPGTQLNQMTGEAARPPTFEQMQGRQSLGSVGNQYFDSKYEDMRRFYNAQLDQGRAPVGNGPGQVFNGRPVQIQSGGGGGYPPPYGYPQAIGPQQRPAPGSNGYVAPTPLTTKQRRAFGTAPGGLSNNVSAGLAAGNYVMPGNMGTILAALGGMLTPPNYRPPTNVGQATNQVKKAANSAMSQFSNLWNQYIGQ